MPYIIPFTRKTIEFISQAGLQGTKEKLAVNYLVRNCEVDDLWNKQTALYGFVGGTATSHKYNLKNPLDTDAAFRLFFGGGWTHSSTGAKGNGTTNYANTYFTTSANASQNNVALSWYIRNPLYRGIGQYSTNMLHVTEFGNVYMGANSAQSAYALPLTTGLYSISRIASNEYKLFNNGNVVRTVAAASAGVSTLPLYLGARREGANPNWITTNEIAFASIGSGLTPSEEVKLYNIVQAYEVMLGRQMDANASTFIGTIGSTTELEANAINNFVINLKYYNLWDECIQILPLCWNNATRNRFDMKGTYTATMNGTITHASRYVTSNGTTGYINTGVNQATNHNQDSNGVSFWSNTNSQENVYVFGSYNGTQYAVVNPRNTLDNARILNNDNGVTYDIANTNSQGFFTFVRTDSTTKTIYKNGVSLGDLTETSVSEPNLVNYFLKANYAGSPYSTRQFQMLIQHRGLNATQVANLNTCVTTFRTQLGL